MQGEASAEPSGPQLACPSCGAPVPLVSAALPYAVCGHCQTLILREGDELKAIGKSAVLPFDVSPIQIGTRGTADGQRFEVIGRVRWGWTDGSWNEWLLQVGAGTAWLGEAMGLYVLVTEAPELLETPLGNQFASGTEIPLGATLVVSGAHFTATDIKQAHSLGGEGQLPFPCPADWTMTNVDFRSEAGGALSLQRDADGVSAWLGRYVTLDELKPVGLRKIVGWQVPTALAATGIS
ncbi:DUF4178 domain-containing protein [Novosphingobium sp.]|uniref:DUF4178 domain-containing protein n=1 Tax=Novosphingobium sp. TaxID=1874826 RepID=UPI0025F40FA2|nr:DUF4178 domain-containing protein [Novosphingobium sp.]